MKKLEKTNMERYYNMKKLSGAEIEQKRQQEIATVSAMIGIYCHGVHKTKRGTLCEECSKLRGYVTLRTNKCPFMETKTFCSACKVHCYTKDNQAKIKAVMRYAGPRMLFSHPVLTIRHGIVTLIKIRQKKEAA